MIDRRTSLAGLSAAALVPIGARAHRHAEVSEALIERNRRANLALMQGDGAANRRLLPISDDFVLMAPSGGTPSRAAEYTPERYERMGRFFRNGDFAQEVVATYASPDMVTLVTIERSTVEVGGLPPQLWALRVTLVFTRHGTDWMLAHRHADPLVEDLPLPQAARLARGERDPAPA